MVEKDPDCMHPPSVEDRAIWDLWLSQYRLPVVLAADQLGLFEYLRDRPASIEDISRDLKLLRRSADALTAALASTGFLVQHAHKFQLTPLSRTYLLPDSEFYWVPMLGAAGFGHLTTPALLNNLRTDNLSDQARVTRRWEHGEMTPEEAAGSNQRMHSHSFPSALGLARSHDFSGTQRLLDVAGGSGGYAIALALQHPHLRCTVADLPPVAGNARTYIERYKCQERVDTLSFNMFDDAWPTGYDGILMTNILHDWDPKRRADLAASSYRALPAGGKLFIHEVLLNDAQDGPVAAAMFSTMMLGTRGKQLSFMELRALLTEHGFLNVQAKPTYGYYSLVIGTR
jgi:acetylserotonin N-methyltransferase